MKILIEGHSYQQSHVEDICGDFETAENCMAEIEATYFRGDLIEVAIDNEVVGDIFIMPYKIAIPEIKKGRHQLKFKLFGNRFNTFGALHNCGDGDWPGPGYWYTEDSEWCYEYKVRETGILKSPVIHLLKKKEY